MPAPRDLQLLRSDKNWFRGKVGFSGYSLKATIPVILSPITNSDDAKILFLNSGGKMNQQEATQFVISELGKHHEKNDIIQKLCESTSMNWNQAEKFIQQVQAEHGSVIAQKQSPLIVAIGSVIVIAGIVVALAAIYVTLQGENVRLRGVPIPYSGNVAYFLIGAAMIGGGLRGMWDTIVRMWNG